MELTSDDVFRASPTGADGKIYCMNEAGEVWVINAESEKLEILANRVDLGGGSQTASRSSIAVADGEVYVRTAEKLYSFGKARVARATSP